MDFVAVLAREFSLRPEQVRAVIELLDAGNTVPFIARYRKEATGSLDDQLLRELTERLEYLRSLDKRRMEIEKSFAEQQVLTDELRAALAAAATLAELEDIYRPFRPKRRTRATIAREHQRMADALCAERRDGCRRVRLRHIGDDDVSHIGAVHRHMHDGSRLVTSVPGHAEPLHELRVADADDVPVDAGAHALSRDLLHVLDGAAIGLAGVGAAQRRRDGMRGIALDVRGEMQELLFRDRLGMDRRHLEHAFRERARLVKDD